MNSKKYNKVAMAVVIRNSKIMIQKRYRQKLGLVYEFPGGSVDTNETPEVAATRELFEETGLIATKTLATFPYTNDFNGTIDFVLLEVSSQAEPKVINKARQQTFFWFELNEIPLNDFHTSDIKFIKTDLNRWLEQSSSKR